MAINIRQHITISDESKTYSYLEGASPKFYEAFFDEFNYRPPSMKTDFDARIESGLGSSASAAVCLVGAISRARGLDMKRYEIAERAWDIEVNKLGLYGGRQDQFAAAYGGMNIFWFVPTGRVDINSVKNSTASYIQKHILLFDTGK